MTPEHALNRRTLLRSGMAATAAGLFLPSSATTALARADRPALTHGVRVADGGLPALRRGQHRRHHL